MASSWTSGRGEQKRDPFLALESPHEKIKSPRTAKQYDVFINHRGPDVKSTLARQLYYYLQQAGIRAYLDSKETELGDFFPSAIRNAISSAAVHIAILSPRYAESAWCLAELSFMFQTKARIIPLFYHVPPSDFRHIKNEVADAFSKHEEKGRYPNHDIQQWKESLQNISWLNGYEFNGHNDDPSKLCNDVVSAMVKEKLKRKIPFQVAKYEVGLDELVKDFHSHCQRNGQMRDKIIGIFGMGGSGKTTLAKYLFNYIHSEFSGSTILFDVRESYAKGKLTSLQSKLLNDLFHLEENKFPGIEDGVALIKDNLQRSCESRFLIVIDDVDHQMQLDALLSIDALNPKSLVIVTTRDERLLIKAGVGVRYKMQEMDREHSRELFCWHAFHTQSCKRRFDNLVNSFVEVCGGLPLALQVMGGHVFGGDKAYWKLQLDVVKARLDKDIKDTLKISYEALENDQKQIFMDIACFFIEEDVSRAISIWKASGWRAEHAIQTLKDKCLVEVHIYFDNEPTFVLRMHDHLRDLGREMADNEMSHPRRLWHPEDLIGMREIKGFQDALIGLEGKSFRCSSYLYDLQNYYSECVLESDLKSDHEKGLRMTYFLGSSKTLTDLQWLQLDYNGYYPSIPEWIPLQNLHTLRLGGVSPVRLCQRDDQVLVKLKELSCSFENVNFENSNQDMFVSDVNKLLSSFGRLKNLENLSIRFGYKIQILEWNCLLESVRELANLQNLELTCFYLEEEVALSNRAETTDDRFRMRSLEAIALCGVFKTRKVSIHGQLCPTLKSLKLHSMAELIEVNFTGLTTLESLEIFNCGELRKVLGNDLLKLEMFHIKSCSIMRELPNFGRVSYLKRIYISHCRTLQDISAIERMKGLKRIWIAYCPELKSIKAIKTLKGLKRIWIQECPQLEDVICLEELKKLKRIFIGQCDRLQNIQGIEFLICLESFIIAECPKLQNIRGIEELKGLKEMIITNSPIINCIERVQRLLSEVTILVWRLAVSDLIEDKIGDTLSKVDAFCEIDCEKMSQIQIEKKIHSFHKAQHLLSTFIFCAKLITTTGDYPVSTCIETDMCNGTRIMLEFDSLRPTRLYRGNGIICEKDASVLVSGDWIYTCVVNEEMFSKYESWMTSHWYVEKAFLMGVKEGGERKTIHILQSLFAQLCIDKSDFPEGRVTKPIRMEEGDKRIDYNELAIYVDDDEKHDDVGDDDNYNDCDDDDNEVNFN